MKTKDGKTNLVFTEEIVGNHEFLINQAFEARRLWEVRIALREGKINEISSSFLNSSYPEHGGYDAAQDELGLFNSITVPHFRILTKKEDGKIVFSGPHISINYPYPKSKFTSHRDIYQLGDSFNFVIKSDIAHDLGISNNSIERAYSFWRSLYGRTSPEGKMNSRLLEDRSYEEDLINFVSLHINCSTLFAKRYLEGSYKSPSCGNFGTDTSRNSLDAPTEIVRKCAESTIALCTEYSSEFNLSLK